MHKSGWYPIWKKFSAYLKAESSWWRFEWPLATAFAAALPLMAFTKQTQAYNNLSELLLPLALFVIAATAMSVLFHVVLSLPSSRLAATLVATYVILVQFPDRLKASSTTALHAFLPGKTVIITLAILMGGSYLVGWLIMRVARQWPSAGNFARTLLASFSIVMLTYQGVALGLFAYRQAGILAYQPPLPPAVTLNRPDSPRDVYYIVLDRYASQAVLQNDFSFDNSSFYQALSERGFTVKPDAFANYPFTAPSLASTLNMSYLTDVTNKLGTQASYSQLPYRRYVENNQVMTAFETAGYHSYNISSWFGVSRDMEKATNISQDQFQFALLGQHANLTDYQQAVLGQSVYATILGGGRHLGPLTIGQMLPTRAPADTFNHQLENLLTVAVDQSSGPKFVFTHLISPHPPYIFLPDGTPVSYNDEDNDKGLPREQKYLNQLQYLNTRILDVVDKIKQASTVPPVIILAADEGPYPRQFTEIASETGGEFQWQSADPAVVRHKAEILQAAYLPDTSPDVSALLSSPVNTFRLIFNQYFDAGLPYLPNCSFIADNATPYRFSDITPVLTGTPGEGCQYLADAHR